MVVAIGVVLGLLASVGPGLDAIEDAADWLGERTVALIALAVILVASSPSRSGA
jgi:hypothetical protein